jgi:hypothetical protein
MFEKFKFFIFRRITFYLDRVTVFQHESSPVKKMLSVFVFCLCSHIISLAILCYYSSFLNCLKKQPQIPLVYLSAYIYIVSM